MKRTIIIILALIAFAHASEARQPKRGYRGFLEWSSSVSSERLDYFDINGRLTPERYGLFYTGLTTSHGYQINSKFFVGAGLGLERCRKFESWIVPVFIQGRIDLKFGKFTPYGDLKLGYNIPEGGGIYISPTIGYRFNWGRKMGVNLGAGLSLAGYKMEHYEIFFIPDYYEIQYVGTTQEIRPYFSFRLGIDF